MDTDRSGWKRWADRSQVERVELYTVQSLYAVLVGLVGLVLVNLFVRPDSEPALSGAVTLIAVVLLALAIRALRDAARLYPESGPLPTVNIGALGASALTAWLIGFALPDDPQAAVSLTVWAVLAFGWGGYRDRRLSLPLLVLLPLALWIPTGTVTSLLYGGLVGAFLVFTVRASLWLYGVVQELDTARTAQASLAVAEERLRFSRDVHDVLGRRLCEIAVHSELAGRLAEAGDPTAPERMSEVRATAHVALREARDLARGYRRVELTQEVEGARSLLSSAGISTYVDLSGLPMDQHEPAGWVIGEAVTNILRHSHARSVRIEYADGVLRVRNDGARSPDEHPAEHPDDPEIVDGSGLRGLAERLAPDGGELTTSCSEGDFCLEVLLPRRSGSEVSA